MQHPCAACERPSTTSRPLCATCERDYLNGLRLLKNEIPSLRALADKQAHIGRREPTHSPTADLPISEHWERLWSRACRLMIRVAALAGDGYGRLPERKWRYAWNRIMAHRMAVLSAPSAGDDYMDVRAMLHEVDEATRPHDPRVTVVDCPGCSKPLAVPAGMRRGTCPRCGMTSDLGVLVERKVESARSLTLTCSPSEAAVWLTDRAMVRVSRDDVKHWIQRGKVHARRLGRGLYEFNAAELIELAACRACDPVGPM